jgi:alpha-L-rhamnosidase
MGDEANLPLFKEYSDGCKKAYGELITKKDYSLDTDRQAKLVRPLYMNLLDESSTEFAKKRLVKALDNYGWRLGTGFLSTPFILDVLADINIDYAYKLLENEEMPGWLFMTKKGATTIWESWEGTEAQGGIASLNHYSKGAVCEWLFRAMCGITVYGENHFVIKPLPGGHFTFASADYKSVFGEVKSGWKKENDKYTYQITIPANCTADIILPNGENHAVKAGEYSF